MAVAPSVEGASLRAYDKVFALVVAGLFQRVRILPHSRRFSFASCGLVTLWPAALNGALLWVRPELALRSMEAMAWVFGLSALTSLVLFGFGGAWNRLSAASPSVDEMLSRSRSRSALVSWFEGWQSLPRQGIVLIFGSMIGCVLLGLSVPALAGHLELGVVSFIMVGWTAAVAVNVLYWGLVIVRFTRRLLALDDLLLLWYSPASTPGIVSLSGGFIYAASFGLGGVLATEAFALLVPNRRASGVLSFMAIFFPVLAVVFALAMGVLPHFWLYKAVRRTRQRVLGQMAGTISPHPPVSRYRMRRIKDQMDVYRMVETSPNLPFSTAASVQFGAAMLGSLVAYFLGLYAGG